MLNGIFLFLVVSAALVGALTGTMPQVTRASIDAAKGAVDLVLALVGQMTLWLGFMGVLREAGLMASLARALRPVLVRLFPDVPAEHPAMGAMVLTVAANVLGLGNAATPFGLKAMAELDRLNPRKGVATDAMALFLAINASGLAVLALNVVAIRASLGSRDPGGILVPSLLATMACAAVAIFTAKGLARLPHFALTAPAAGGSGESAPPAADEARIAGLEEAEALAAPRAPASGARRIGTGLVAAVFVGAAVWRLAAPPPGQSAWEVARGMMSDWLLPLLMVTICLVGFGRRVRVYEVFIASAKEGFQIGVAILPYLVAILVAVGMFRASGALDRIVGLLGPLTSRIGFPAEALPMALIRPLSGSGALAVMSETMKVHGPDSFVGYLVSVLNGSMETTFYMLAVYFGSVQVRSIRHTLAACLTADVAGVVASTALCHLFFG